MSDANKHPQPGDRVRTLSPNTLDRKGTFRRMGSNGLAQVQWDGNKSVAYIAPSLIEKDKEV